jgi:Tol biopolymer transport system component
MRAHLKHAGRLRWLPVLNGIVLTLFLGALSAGSALAGGITTRVSVDNAGIEGNSGSSGPSISADGLYVAFESDADNLVPDDSNFVFDVFVRDRQTGTTTRVSVDNTGNQGDDDSSGPSISADGRYVAFESFATNLVPGDTNAVSDVFVHDRQTGQTALVSVDSAGVQGNGDSFSPSISADGRYVAFESFATDLVPGDTNAVFDVFVHDRLTGQTTRVSVDSSGSEGEGDSYSASISADGRYVAFTSDAPNLVPGDTNVASDVFVHDRLTGLTARASVESAGNQGNSDSFEPSISGDGLYVAFTSLASNLVTSDNNDVLDVFVRDRQSGTTTRVSVDNTGNQGDGDSYGPSISADGRYVAFQSFATDLVPGDNNSAFDVYVRDRQSGLTTRVSVDSSGSQGDGDSYSPSISGNGRFVAVESIASNLVPDDTNDVTDIFVRQMHSAVPNDFDGDLKTDIAIWRPSTGQWWIQRSSDNAVVSIPWGSPTDNIVPGDYNGDGKTDAAIWRPSTGVWWIQRSSDNAVVSIPWGSPTDNSVPGDYNGDGKTDAAIWRPSTGVWWIQRSSDGAVVSIPWGSSADIPVPGDYDGDGKTDAAIWRPSTGQWWIQRSSDSAVVSIPWGSPTDTPVPGDYDGDGKTDAAIWRPSTGQWWIQRSSDSAVVSIPWGSSTDTPVPGDYDGDGKTDAAIWRPSTGQWWIQRSLDSAVVSIPWGSASDIPLKSRY